jgi:cytochrome c553
MKMSPYLCISLAVLPLSAFSAEPDPNMAKAQSLANHACVVCHGMNGVSVIDNYPSLAGQKESYLIKQMKAFRDGNRKDPVMWNMVASLDEPMIAALAKFYAAKKLP